MITKQDLLDQRESIQADLECVLDGIDDEITVENACQVVVDHFQILLEKSDN